MRWTRRRPLSDFESATTPRGYQIPLPSNLEAGQRGRGGDIYLWHTRFPFKSFTEDQTTLPSSASAWHCHGVMSSNSAATSSSSKAVNAASQTISPVHSQVGPQSNTDGGSQRRAGGSGSFGSGSATRNYSSPRNNQSQRKNHKGQRRARLADEDAYAESVSRAFEALPATSVTLKNSFIDRHEVYQ